VLFLGDWSPILKNPISLPSAKALLIGTEKILPLIKLQNTNQAMAKSPKKAPMLAFAKKDIRHYAK